MAPAAAALAEITLDDKYALEDGQIFLSGTQALVRLLLEQRRRDVRAGLNTAGFVSGYRGSPMGTFDTELNRARCFLDEHHIHFRPGVNEDLAATSVWGTQQVPTLPGAKYDGVFSLWYGKGPGVDRSGDALKHGNMAGTSKHGGVLVAFGDDHGAKSSTVAHQSEYALVAAFIPILNPSNVQDILDFGLAGWAMSRFAGLWVGLKGVNETLLSAATVSVHPEEPRLVIPEDFAAPDGLLNLDTRSRDDTRGRRYPVERESRLVRLSLPAAQAFARANRLDRLALGAPKGRLGIVTTGKAYLDVVQALTSLGIDAKRAGALGIGVYKVGLAWPVEPEGLKRFASEFEEILVVEEKRPLIEDQIPKILYPLPADRRPRIVGKTDESGAPLLPADESLDAARVAAVIFARLGGLGGCAPDIAQRHETIAAAKASRGPTAPLTRIPYFCSGCPHNTSTRVPEGSVAFSGIGCHTLAYSMPDRPTSLPTQMGGEGGTWIGIAPFVEMPHVFQNIGDGTYHHSGLSAIRAAVASGVNITFKILFNDAVAMTGGQPVDGVQTVPGITRQVDAEGVAKIIVVTDEPDKYPLNAGFAPGATIRHRDEMDLVQRELRDVPGVTVLIYDQTCAAEKRRRRRRGLFPDPPKRAFINDAVCEGCGDCNVQSNCVSVQPLETEFGRKRQIDQSSCNKDFSCLKGFCPSFVTVHGGTVRAAPARAADVMTPPEMPEPAQPDLADAYGILITGIGGTGVVTIGAVLATAAHMEGKGASVYDMTGLAQKNGAVMSHLTVAPNRDGLGAVTIGQSAADLILGCDLVVSRSPDAMATIAKGRTSAVVNSHLVPTATFQQNIDLAFPVEAMTADIAKAVGEDQAHFVDATGLATALFADSITANFFTVGYAYQLGRVPISAAAIEAAIRLNGLSVERNIAAFRWGRVAAVDLDKVVSAAGIKPAEIEEPSLDDLIAHRRADLVRYQNEAYAERYTGLVELARKAEEATGTASTDFAEAVARNLYKLMAYKDEYEVARLYTDGTFEAKLRKQFAGRYKLRFHLAPPLLTSRDPVTGRAVKREYGAWMMTALRLLARFKGLRGTWADPFGRTEERRTERALIAEYESLIEGLAATLTKGSHSLAVELASVPAMIRGYGHVKARSVAEARKRQDMLLAMLRERAALTEAA